MGSLQNAGDGLKKMYIAQVGTVVCSAIAMIPVVNVLAAIGGIIFLVISLIGMNIAGKEIAGCKTAFHFSIANLVGSIVAAMVTNGFLSAVISIVNDVLALFVIYYVCTSVAELLKQMVASDAAQFVTKTWNINLGCYIAMMVLTILTRIPVLGMVFGLIVTILALVASVFYMLFLNKACQACGV